MIVVNLLVRNLNFIPYNVCLIYNVCSAILLFIANFCCTNHHRHFLGVRMKRIWKGRIFESVCSSGGCLVWYWSKPLWVRTARSRCPTDNFFTQIDCVTSTISNWQKLSCGLNESFILPWVPDISTCTTIVLRTNRKIFQWPHARGFPKVHRLRKLLNSEYV